MGTVAADLEAKRMEDSSWHPCRVSLKPSSDSFTSSGLILDIEGQSFVEVIFSKEEAMKRLRMRSTPLQGDECFHVKEGEHVLASQTTKFGILFFDAEVEKVYGVRHSKRNPCRCTFRVKWLCRRPGARSETVPASSIMKLATTPIDSHSTVVEFLNSFATYSCSGASSFASLSEEPGFEFDLEKQIEELSRLADVSDNGVPQGHRGDPTEVDLTGQVRHRTLAAQVNDHSPHEQNSRRTTRSRKKVSLESETVQSPPKSVTVEPDRPLLSPLGARAALASLMYSVEREGFTNADQNTFVDHTLISVNVNSTITDFGPSTRKKVSIKDGLLSNVEDSLAPVDLKQTKVRRSGRRDASNSFSQNEEDNVGSKSGSSRNTTRATRSAVQKGIGLSDNEVELKSSFEEMKPPSPTPTRTSRFTRSAIQKDTINENVEISKRPQEKELVQGSNSGLTRLRQNETEHSDDENDPKSSSDEAKLLSTTQTPRFTRSALQKETSHTTEDVLQKAVNETLDIDKEVQEVKSVQGTNSRSTRRRNQNGTQHSNSRVDSKSSSEEPNILTPTQTPRFTRSAIQKETSYLEVDVLQNEAENGTADNKGQQKGKSARSTNSRSTRLRSKDGIEHPTDETNPKPSEEPKLLSPTPTQTPRFTRSAIQKEIKHMEVEVLHKETVNENTEQEESQIAQETCSDPMREDFVTPQNKEIRGKKPLTSSDDEVKLSEAQESNKKQRVSKDKGEIAETGARLQGKNSVSAAKASLVLRSSPRTRSKKSS